MKKQFIVIVVIILAVVGILVGIRLNKEGGEEAVGTVAVGSKHFTEQRILGEMLAQLIEEKTDLNVERRIGLQGTKVVFGALREGDIDAYPEYTGTGLVNILEQKYDPKKTPEEIRTFVTDQYKEKWNLIWMDPLGFDNTYAFAMREEQAEKLGITKISDLEQHIGELKIGFDHEFTMRPEFKRFEQVYGFAIPAAAVSKLAPDVMYTALAEKDVDLIDAFSTDGRIAAYNLRVLEDDKHLFPPYDAGIVVRGDTLEKYPQLREALASLSGQISPTEMRKMNYAVTEENVAARIVARKYLEAEGLIEAE